MHNSIGSRRSGLSESRIASDHSTVFLFCLLIQNQKELPSFLDLLKSEVERERPSDERVSPLLCLPKSYHF